MRRNQEILASLCIEGLTTHVKKRRPWTSQLDRVELLDDDIIQRLEVLVDAASRLKAYDRKPRSSLDAPWTVQRFSEFFEDVVGFKLTHMHWRALGNGDSFAISTLFARVVAKYSKNKTLFRRGWQPSCSNCPIEHLHLFRALVEEERLRLAKERHDLHDQVAARCVVLGDAKEPPESAFVRKATPVAGEYAFFRRYEGVMKLSSGRLTDSGQVVRGSYPIDCTATELVHLSRTEHAALECALEYKAGNAGAPALAHHLESVHTAYQQRPAAYAPPGVSAQVKFLKRVLERVEREYTERSDCPHLYRARQLLVAFGISRDGRMTISSNKRPGGSSVATTDERPTTPLKRGIHSRDERSLKRAKRTTERLAAVATEEENETVCSAAAAEGEGGLGEPPPAKRARCLSGGGAEALPWLPSLYHEYRNAGDVSI